MDFGEALDELRDEGNVTRAGWNGKDQYLSLYMPEDDQLMTLPYIYITTVSGDRVPWHASQTDVLADDWEVTY